MKLHDKEIFAGRTMNKQITKLQAHTDQLVSCLLGLKEKYAFLRPMLFDGKIVKHFGSGERRRGFESIKYSLFYGCAQDIARITLDNDKRTPSICGIITPLLINTGLLDELCVRYSSWGYIVRETDDAELRAALESHLAEETELRRQKFHATFNKLIADWDAFKVKQSTDAFKIIRDKLTAHLELHLCSDDVYRITDIAKLGLKWRDLGEAIKDVEIMITALNSIVRNAGFAMEDFDEGLEKAIQGYWAK